MESKIINISLEKFLAYRSERNLEYFAQSISHNEIELVMQASSGITLRTEMAKKYPDAMTILKHSNTPLNLESLMIQTHNFGDSASWADSTDSSFTLTPNPGYKLIVTSIVARFPDSVNLTENPLSFQIWKYVPPYGLVPAVTETYYSIKDLLVTSNSWWHTVEFTNSFAFGEQMLEVKFRYAADDVDDWSKLTLFSSRGEKIVCSLANNVPLKKNDGSPLLDPCYSIFNTKRVLDF